jgi:uncharacterized protein HemX
MATVMPLSYERTYVEFPSFYGYGYGGIKSFFTSIWKGAKKVVTSTPVKVAAGVALIGAALPVVSSAIGGAAGAAGAAATAGKVGTALIVGKTIADTAMQYQLGKKQAELIEAQKQAIQSESVLYQQALAQQLQAQQLQAQQMQAQQALAQQLTQQQMPVQQQVLAQQPIQQQMYAQPHKKDNWVKYAAIGGGILLLTMLLLNR